MGLSLFDSRNDNVNVFNEMSVNNYHINLKLNDLSLPDIENYAGIFNNRVIPDSIDLITNGLNLWNRHKSRSKNNFALVICINDLQAILETNNPNEVFKLNSYFDQVFKFTENDKYNTLILIINPFQDYNRCFNYVTKDSFDFESKYQSLNYLDNNIWASGKNSNQFSGSFRNIDIHDKMLRLIKK